VDMDDDMMAQMLAGGGGGRRGQQARGAPRHKVNVVPKGGRPPAFDSSHTRGRPQPRAPEDDEDWETESDSDSDGDDISHEEGAYDDSGDEPGAADFDFSYLASGMPSKGKGGAGKAAQAQKGKGRGAPSSSSSSSSSRKDAEMRELKAEAEMLRQMQGMGGFGDLGMAARLSAQMRMDETGMDPEMLQTLAAMQGGDMGDISSEDDSDAEDEMLRNDPLLGGMYAAQYGKSSNNNSRSAAAAAASSSSGPDIRVGDTVKLADGDLAKVAFVGAVHYAKGEFAGVVMKNANKGKNDGSVKGQRYFTCAKGQGLMVKLRDVQKVR